MSSCILDIFENTVSRFSDKTAIADQNISLSFKKLREYALVISDIIAQHHCPIIGVMAHRDAFTIPVFFGVLYSGGCYVPLDPYAPTEKITKIINTAGLNTVISCHKEDRIAIESAGAEFVYLSKDQLAQPQNQIQRKFADQDLLYIVFTSGSTGEPKGVEKSHYAMKNFIDSYIKEFSFDDKTIIGNQTPFYFDASAKDIYLMASTGATIEIIPTTLFSFPVRLIEYMDQRKINFISWVPSALSIVTALNTFSEIKPKYLNRVFFVGEVFPVKHLNRWISALPEIEYVNLYGSSEICGISLFYRVKGEFDKDASIPMGKPLSNCDVKLVDQDKVIFDPGIIGEVYIASDALANGYHNNIEKTNKSFIALDLGEGLKRYYRSGDVAKYDEKGNLIFAARTDHQIKHMGHRIELGEIEAATNAIDGVEKCCCLYNSKRQRIILYIQPESDAIISDTKIRAALKNKLSDYMMPQKYIISEALPLNANGKIDRIALSAILK